MTPELTSEETSQPEQGQQPTAAQNLGAQNPSAQNRRKPSHESARKRAPGQSAARPTKTFVSIHWSYSREPLDDLVWAEAHKEGEWLEVREVAQIRTRREILERLAALTEGLVGINFPFSFPKPFVDFLKESEGLGGWRPMLHKVREDLKKNTDDGVRLWIDRMGAYRESQLEDESQADERFRGRGPKRGLETLAPHERFSKAERFRRTELAIRRPAQNHVHSALQIAFNRLTGRYEFSDEAFTGRSALLGMSMLDQLLEEKEGVSVWPFSKAGRLTLIEIQPWVFGKGRTWSPEQCREMLAAEEDTGVDIDDDSRVLICRNLSAQSAFRNLLGMYKSENRIERAIRPLRDYSPKLYEDDQIAAEGWYYGVGYRVEEEEKRPRSKEKQPRESRKASRQDEASPADSNDQIAAKATLSQTPSANGPSIDEADPTTLLGNDLQGAATIPQAVEPETARDTETERN